MNTKIKKIRQLRKSKEITRAILDIAAVGGLAIIAGGGSQSPTKATKAISALADFSISRVKQCLKRLKMQDYIKYDEEDIKGPIFLTDKGLVRHVAYGLCDKIKLFRMKKWDHLWRLVTFDVKEGDRWRRDGFRRRLNALNFYKLQKNIYVTPYPAEEEIERLVRSFGLWKNACILHVADLGKKEEEIKKFFIKIFDRKN